MNGDDGLVTLDWYEYVIAAVIGILRTVEAERLRCRPSSTKEDHAIARVVDATGAEVAVAKYLNRFWLTGVNCFDMADVAPNIEVRQTPNTRDPKLIIRPRDYDDRPFVLASGTIPTYRVVGWMYGRDGKRAEWLCNPRGDGEMYHVPAEALNTVFPKRNGKKEEDGGGAEAEQLRLLREECCPPEEEQ